MHLESFGLSIFLRTCHVRISLRMREFTTHRTTDRHNVNLRTLRRYVHLESFGPSILLWRSKSSINSWDIDACHSIFMNEYVSLCQFIDLPETLQSCRKNNLPKLFFYWGFILCICAKKISCLSSWPSTVWRQQFWSYDDGDHHKVMDQAVRSRNSIWQEMWVFRTVYSRI